MQENPNKRYELTTRATNGCSTNGYCRDHCSGIHGTFVPIGKMKNTDLMVYARTELDSNGIYGPNVQYYFYEMGNGKWEFTWDTWMNLANVDLNNFGNCEFLKRVKRRYYLKFRVQARYRSSVG